MKVLTSREFAATWRSLTEAVRVEARGKLLLTVYPAGTEPSVKGPLPAATTSAYPVGQDMALNPRRIEPTSTDPNVLRAQQRQRDEVLRKVNRTPRPQPGR